MICKQTKNDSILALDEKLEIISSMKPYDQVLHPNLIYQRHNSIWYIEGETNVTMETFEDY